MSLEYPALLLKINEFEDFLKNLAPSKSANVQQSIKDTLTSIKDYSKIISKENLYDLLKYIYGEPPIPNDDDDLLCHLHTMRTFLSMHVGADRNYKIPTSLLLLPDQKAILSLLLQKKWIGPCSLHVLLREVKGETPSMVILFGEYHRGFLDNGQHGMTEFFRQVSHFPVEIFTESHLTPESVASLGTGHPPQSFDTTHRIGSIVRALYEIRRNDISLGFKKNRFHFVDTRDLHTNADAVWCGRDKQTPGLFTRMASAWDAKMQTELATIGKGHDYDWLKSATRNILSKTSQVCSRKCREGNSPECLIDVRGVMIAWVDVYSVSRMIRKLQRYHTAILYAGNGHIMRPRPPEKRCIANARENNDLGHYGILPSFESLGFHIIYAQKGCYWRPPPPSPPPPSPSPGLDEHYHQSSLSHSKVPPPPWVAGEGGGGRGPELVVSALSPSLPPGLDVVYHHSPRRRSLSPPKKPPPPPQRRRQIEDRPLTPYVSALQRRRKRSPSSPQRRR
jgi:hypothetical protein